MMPSPGLRDPILVVGGYGYGNVGDEAILAGQLRRLAGRRVTVVSRDPAQTSALHGVRAIAIRDATAALRTHRSVLIGGGGLFGRHMGRAGRLLPAFGLLALALGRSVAVDGVGIDSEMPVPTRLALRALLRRAASISVRDEASADVLREWSIRAAVEPDRSALMPAAPADGGRRLLMEAGVDGRRPVIGLCLTAVEEALVPGVIAAVDELMRDLPDCDFCFVPMSRHPSVRSHDDRVLATEIRDRHPELRVLDTSVHPAVVLAAFGGFSAAVCMRYHALLFAERSGVPVVAVPYAPKVEAWMAAQGIAAVALRGAAWVQALRALLPDRGLAQRRIAS